MIVEETFSSLGIRVKNNSVQQKVQCPNCIKLGKENYKDTCLSINIKDGLYNCHKCGWHGVLKTNGISMNKSRKSYKKPQKNKLKKLTKQGRTFLNSRGITDEVIKNNKIVSSLDNKSIVFPYLVDNEIVNYKTRGIDGKFFTQSKDAEPVIYNYDNCKERDTIVICEGEMDSLSWEVAGIPFHTSVNMGAPNIGDKNIDKKLECITCKKVWC
mgnify:FL=1